MLAMWSIDFQTITLCLQITGKEITDFILFPMIKDSKILSNIVTFNITTGRRTKAFTFRAFTKKLVLPLKKYK